MSDHVNHIRNIIYSTWRCCSLLGGWISSEVLNHLLTRSNLSEEKEGCFSNCMDQTQYINISSSDDELEEIEGPTGRILPQWGNTQRSIGHGKQSEHIRPEKRANASNGNYAADSYHSQIKSHNHNRSSNNTLNWEADRSSYFLENGHSGPPWTVNYRISNSPGLEYEKMSSHQALKRTLPSSVQPHTTKTLPSSSKLSASNARSSNVIENTGSSQIRDTLGSSYHSTGPGMNVNKGFMQDPYGRGGDDGVSLYQNGGSRILPPSMHGKPYSATPYASSSDLLYRSGAVEERTAEDDERLIYQAALEDLNQPKVEANVPDGLLSVSLLRHQKIALAWMLQKETRSLHCLGGILADDQGLGKTVSMIALIQVQRQLQSRSKLEDSCNKKTEALNLDDDDESAGVNQENSKKTEVDDVKPDLEASSSRRAFHGKRPAAGTLVVCPASVLRQWARELDEKVAEEAKLEVLVYHGGNRTKDPVELAKYEVVLTTYAIVTNEVPKQPLVDDDDIEEKNGEKYGLSSEFSTSKKRKKGFYVNKKGKKDRKGIESSIDYGSGPLAKVGWFRVILDEAQTIKNHRTQVARACCSLRAKRRWCLSGTPIQNAIDDLYSYFRFLKYDPYAVYKSFYNTIKVPISKNSIQGYKKLQAVLRAIMLRRTKGTFIDGEPIIKLPPKMINLSKVDFSTEERAFYTKLEADSRSQFKEYAAAGTLSQNYANILLMLLRLRQACDHPLLVKDNNSDSVGKFSVEMAKCLPRDMLINLLNCLEASSAICHKCNDPPEDPVVTMCEHVFCYQCVSEYMTGDDNTCPAVNCKEQLGDDVVFSKATLRSCLAEDCGASSSKNCNIDYSIVQQSEYSSSKIRSLLEILESLGKRRSPSCALQSSGMESCSESITEGPLKAIVFSQWTGMLDLVEISLNQSFMQYRRLDGSMTLASRDKAVKEFNTDPEVTVMLMSLKAGNLGLNLVAACHVILLDLWWNPTTEDQAIDRAHRIGQTRPVTVTRVTIKNTVEDRILALQEEKRKMVASAFGEDQSGGSATRLTVDDLKYLFMV